MLSKKKNSCDVAVAALEVALLIIEQKSKQKAEAGATIWIRPDGSVICVRITAEDAARIPGAVYVGGPCQEAASKVQIEK